MTDASDAAARSPGATAAAVSPGADRAERLQATLDERDRLLAIAAHDIRTPLASLRLYLDALIKSADRGALDPAAAAVKLRKAQRQCDRLTVLVSNMMDATRGPARPLSLTLEPVDLIAVVTASCERLRDQFTTQGRTLSVEAPPGPISGDWDRTRLEQVLNNLLSNIYKHAPGASARVRVEPADRDRVLLHVSDDGPGIRAEDRLHLFDREAVPRNTSTGMGRGLWITARIVEAFGGTIRLEDGPVDETDLAQRRGASFALDLPRRPLTAPAPATPARP